MQFLITLDQLFNTFTWLPEDGFGMVDETLSARAYRLRKQHPLLISQLGLSDEQLDQLFLLVSIK